MSDSESVAAALRVRVTDGTLAVGDAYPTLDELTAEFGVARQTAQNAMDQLRREGLVDSQQGRRSRVAPQHPPREIRWDRFSTAMRAKFATETSFAKLMEKAGWQGRTEFFPPERVTVDGRIAELLGSDVVCRYRLRWAAAPVPGGHGREKVVEIFTSWYPMWVIDRVPDFMTRDLIVPGSEMGLIEATGVAFDRWEDRVTSHITDDDETEAFDLAAPCRVTQVERSWFSGDQVVIFDREVRLPGQVELVYEGPHH